MSNLIAREFFNGALIPLNACIIIIIAYTLASAYSNPPPGGSWTDTPGVKSACALFWVFLADFMRSVAAWSFLNAQSSGGDVNAVASTITVVYLTAAVIATLATFRLVYALSPVRWGHKGWIASAVLTVVFVTSLFVFF